MTRAATGLNVLRRSKESLFDPIDLRPTSTGTPVRASVPSATPPHDRTPLHRPAPEHYGSQPTPSSSTPEEDAHDRNAILFGTALHYALEMMTDFDPGTVKFALEAMRNRYGQLLLDHQIDDIRTRLERLTTDTSFRALIAEATLWQEQPISYRGEVRRIDLLLEYPDHYTVIDYKSSDKHLGDHVRQMRDYIQAIESIRHKPTDGYLLYLLPKTIALHKIDRT
jgi:exodeoxyribonuclease V beta subunit